MFFFSFFSSPFFFLFVVFILEYIGDLFDKEQLRLCRHLEGIYHGLVLWFVFNVGAQLNLPLLAT